MAVFNVWTTVKFRVFHEDAIDPNVDMLRDALEAAGFTYDTIEWGREEAGEADL